MFENSVIACRLYPNVSQISFGRSFFIQFFFAFFVGFCLSLHRQSFAKCVANTSRLLALHRHGDAYTKQKKRKLNFFRISFFFFFSGETFFAYVYNRLLPVTTIVTIKSIFMINIFCPPLFSGYFYRLFFCKFFPTNKIKTEGNNIRFELVFLADYV